MNRLGTGRRVPQSTSRNVFLIGIGGQHGLSQLNSWIGSAGHGEPQPSSINEGADDVNPNSISAFRFGHNYLYLFIFINISCLISPLHFSVDVSVAQADSLQRKS